MKIFNYNISKMSSFEKNFVHLFFLIPLMSIFIISFIFTPNDLKQKKGILGFTPNCSFKQVTGKPCLTCGMSRAFSSISHGNLGKAGIYNKGAVICYFSLATVTIMLLISYVYFMYTTLNQMREKNE